LTYSQDDGVKVTDEHNYAQTDPQLTRKKLDLALKSLAK